MECEGFDTEQEKKSYLKKMVGKIRAKVCLVRETN